MITAEIDVPGNYPLTAVCAHFQCCADGGETRNIEANFTADLCESLYSQGKKFFLAGDLNDDPNYYRSPSKVHTILLNENPGAHLVQLQPTDDDNDKDSYVDSSAERRYDFLYPVSSLSDTYIESEIIRTESMDYRPAWLSSSDSADASDHRLVYVDFTAVPEPGIVWIIGFLGFRIITKMGSCFFN